MVKSDPKNGLKVGDKVMRQLDHSHSAFHGDRGPYTIVKITAKGDVTLDRTPRGERYAVADGWDAAYFDKVEDAPAKGEWIIILHDGHKLAPAHNPRTYSTEAQAKAVAASMAEKHPGQTFLIFKAVGKAKTNAATVEMF